MRYGLQASGASTNEPKGLAAANLDETNWQKLDVPHDIAITGPFRYDIAGNTGRLPFQCIGWYRKTFALQPEDAGKNIYVDFDGVMANAKVWCNGQYVGTWPYGYTSFRMNLTPYVKTDGSSNVLAVRTDTEHWDSRWYPGAGIYRNVWLVKTEKVHVAHWGTSMTTPTVNEQGAALHFEVELANESGSPAKVMVETTIHPLSPDDKIGKKLLSLPSKTVLLNNKSQVVEQEALLKKYNLWDIEKPCRYVAKTQLTVDGKPASTFHTTFGIRTITYDHKGLYLNNRKVDVKGVCLHHDLGAIGTALNKSALHRQLRMMQEMGCNSIRTSHNPAAPELIEFADKMGFLVMEEAFDCWQHGKREWDYNKLYKDWHEKDLHAMVMRDRNHPSVYSWSIGNEVMEQTNVEMTKHLADITRRLDPTRPVSCGYNNPDGGRASGASTALDIMGVNYFFGRQAEWDKDERYRNMATIGTETSSCVSSRGVYFLDGKKRQDFQISSYDFDYPGWGCSPDRQFQILHEFPHLLGEYVWTGFDYLGEPTPFNSDHTNLLNFRNDPAKQKELAERLAELERNQPPSRSSYFGIVDLAGFPKDRYYSYLSHWRPAIPTAHLFPHWNWEGHEGKKIPMHVYTSGDEAELFINGISQGRKKKTPGKDFRLVWENVTYQPGKVEVVAYKQGKRWATDCRETTGKASRIHLESDRKSIKVGSNEYAFITIRVEDEKGRLVPTAMNELNVSVSGAGALVATDNGDATSFVSFQSPRKKAFNGLLLAIVKATKAGSIKVSVTGDNLGEGHLKIHGKLTK